MQTPIEMTGAAPRLLAAAGGDTSLLGSLPNILDQPLEYLKLHTPQYLTGIAVLVVGFFLSRWVGTIMARTLERQALEPPVRQLMVRLSRLTVLAISLVIALGAAGFEIAALLTGVGVIGVGIGLGMQGLLSNIVAGLTIIFTKPFRVSEYIEILGVHGLVTHIDLVSTTLQHGDGSRVVIPNHKIIGEILRNYGTTRQLDLSVGVGYSTDLKLARSLVAEILRDNARVLKNPAPVVMISSLGDSAITLSVKPWVALADVGPAQTEVHAALIEKFRAHGVDIPSPQREIRIKT